MVPLQRLRGFAPAVLKSSHDDGADESANQSRDCSFFHVADVLIRTDIPVGGDERWSGGLIFFDAAQCGSFHGEELLFQNFNYKITRWPYYQEMDCRLRGAAGKEIVQAELAVAASHLGEGALIGLLVRPPAKKFCPVAEAVAGKMIVADFADQLRLQRLPFARPPC